jgi:hypothetical protein
MAMQVETSDESARWLRFLSRWALATALAALALLLAFGVGLGLMASDSAQGPDYVELLQAARSPGAYRVFTTLDALGWLMIGVTLLALAGAVRRQTPVRATLLAACALGTLLGSLGGVLRLYGISDLAARYGAADPAQQTALLPSFLDLERVIASHFLAGDLIVGIGYLLAGSAVLGLAGFPRWLGLWLFLAGVPALALFGLGAVGAPFSFPLLMVYIIGGVVALDIALAIRLRRPLQSPAMALRMAVPAEMLTP